MSSTGFQLYPWKDIIIQATTPKIATAKTTCCSFCFAHKDLPEQAFPSPSPNPNKLQPRSRENFLCHLSKPSEWKILTQANPPQRIVVGKNFSGFSCVFLRFSPLSRDCESRKKVSLREKNTFLPWRKKNAFATCWNTSSLQLLVINSGFLLFWRATTAAAVFHGGWFSTRHLGKFSFEDGGGKSFKNWVWGV